MAPHLILFLAADPVGRAQLDLDQECADIEDELRRTAARDAFELRSCWALTVDGLMRHLSLRSPTLLHFSGHATDAGLELQSDDRQAHTIDGPALAKMIGSAAPSARVVVLNACYSDALADALRAHVDVVIGMTTAIEDTAARKFAVGFYRALGNRSSVGNAFDQGVATLAGHRLPDEISPRCRTRDGVDAHALVLAPPPATDPIADRAASAAEGAAAVRAYLDRTVAPVVSRLGDNRRWMIRAQGAVGGLAFVVLVGWFVLAVGLDQSVRAWIPIVALVVLSVAATSVDGRARLAHAKLRALRDVQTSALGAPPDLAALRHRVESIRDAESSAALVNAIEDRPGDPDQGDPDRG